MRHFLQRRMSADTDERCCPGQACPYPGSPRRYFASDEETAGSILPSRRGFPPASLFSYRLLNLMVVSDFGSRMGVTISGPVRLTIFNCEGYHRGVRSRPGLARKPSRRPGRYCIRRSRVLTSVVS